MVSEKINPKKIKKQLEKTYNTIAEDFDNTRHKPWEEVVQFLKTIKDKNAAILDLGCGNGRHLKAAKEIGFKNLIAVDFSLSFLDIVRKNIHEAKIIQSDLTDLSEIESNSIDAILYIASLHHLPTQKECMKSLDECYRILKQKGKIIISCWSSNNEKFQKIKDKNNDIMHTWDKKHKRFYHLFSENELTKLLEKPGFKKLQEWKSKDNVWATAEK